VFVGRWVIVRVTVADCYFASSRWVVDTRAEAEFWFGWDGMLIYLEANLVREGQQARPLWLGVHLRECITVQSAHEITREREVFALGVYNVIANQEEEWIPR
jgi:hypothetical protein